MSVLVGTKIKEAETWLSRFLLQLDALEDPVNRIVVMYAESRDNSFAILDHWRRNITKHNVEVYADPYLPPDERHGAMLSRVKQDIQCLLKTGGEQYYLNLDCDLVEIPPDIISVLKSHDKDLIASMNWTEGRHPRTFFDVYQFRLENCMFHPYRPPGLDKTEPFTVDSVSTCYLAKSEVELAGKYVNPYPHIPFCKSLKEQGFQVWVDPTCHCIHVDLEKYGIFHQALPVAYSSAPFIDCTGRKLHPLEVAAERHHLDILTYQLWIAENKPRDAKKLLSFMEKRELLTASLKVYNDEAYLPFMLKAVYPYVDCIDIVYGVVEKNRHSTVHVDDTKKIVLEFPDPQKKIRFIERRVWRDKQEIQAKLLEVCRTKWMLYIDADEIVSESGMKTIREFCLAHQDGSVVHARPKRFLHFFHDWKHIAYSLNPLNAWGKETLPHPFLIWRDVPGLNFASFHTIPVDGFNVPIHIDHPKYVEKQAVLNGVTVFHFGNAKSPERMRDKLTFEHNRQRADSRFKIEKDFWFDGEMPPDFIIEEFSGKYPRVLKHHPMRNKRLIKVTETRPVYKFKRIDVK